MLSIYDASCSQRSGEYYFSWKLKGDCGQADYRICVNNSWGELVWDSGIRKDFRRHNIRCEAELQKGERYEFTVSCHGTNGEETKIRGTKFYTGTEKFKALWVEPVRVRKPLTDSRNPHEKLVETNPLERLDPAVYFRKKFTLEEIPPRAFLYATAHGIYRLWINGIEVSELFAPGFTSYKKRLEYQCYEVSQYLHTGGNVLAAVVADGWYTGKIGAVGCGQQYGSENAVLFQLEGRTENKTLFTVCSDEKVRWTTGALRYADLFVGTYYDDEKEPKGFQFPEFDDSDWKAVKCPDYGYENLCVQTIPPVEETRVITPKIFYSPSGELILAL